MQVPALPALDRSVDWVAVALVDPRPAMTQRATDSIDWGGWNNVDRLGAASCPSSE